jgi:hypothetical protein
LAPIPPLYADYEGACALLHSYLASATDDIRFLSAGGPAEAVKAVLAGLAQGSRVTLFRRTDTKRQFVGYLHGDPTLTWRIQARRLPCGQVHGLLSPNTNPQAARTDFTLLLPRAQEGEAPRHLLRLIDTRTTIPLHPSWAPWLWQRCEEEDWLTPLSGEGGWIGWDVHWSESALTHQVTDAITRRILTAPAGAPG